MRIPRKLKESKHSVRHLEVGTNKSHKRTTTTSGIIVRKTSRENEPWGKNQLIVGSYVTNNMEDDIIFKCRIPSLLKKNRPPRVIRTINKFIVG